LLLICLNHELILYPPCLEKAVGYDTCRGQLLRQSNRDTLICKIKIMKSLILFLLLGAGFCVQAQDLTGIWRGNFKRTPTAANGRLLDLLGGDERYKFEVQLDQHAKNFQGVTYSYLTTVFYGKATCQGAINPVTKQVMLEETKIVEVRMAGGSDACIMTLFLKYSKENDEEFLEGNYISFNTKDSSNCGKGTVFLRKVTTSDFYEEPFLSKKKPAEKKPIIKPDTTAAKKAIVKTTPKTTPKTTTPKTTIAKTTTPVKKPVTANTAKTVVPKNNITKAPDTKPNTDVKLVPVDSAKKAEVTTQKAISTIPVPKVLATRENALVKTITTSANTIELNIYDNGAIDNDSISVYLDKKLVLSHQRLTEKAITYKFNLDETNNYHELVMVADNLGDIPPNTSLMVVKAGDKRYEVRIESNEQKNAVVVFKYEK
jgi:hypothetical protein